MPLTCFRLALIVGLTPLVAAPFARAGAPDEELLRLAPADAHLILLVKDLRGQSAAVSNGPFAQAFHESKLGRAVAALPEVIQLERVRKQIEQALGVDWARVRDDVLGDAVVFAYQAGAPGHPEHERG